MIHQYKLNGYNIVIYVYSGSVHSVDEVAYDLIALFEAQPREQIIEDILAKYPQLSREEAEACYSDVQALKDEGLLFAEDVYSDKADILKTKNNVIKALCLHVAHSCNLNCEYCFASQGKYQGDRALMTFEVGKRALDFLIENSGTRVNLEVDFFGGEPLMNWDVVKQLVEYAVRRNAISASATLSPPTASSSTTTLSTSATVRCTM